jgi:hypothetical protein
METLKSDKVEDGQRQKDKDKLGAIAGSDERGGVVSEDFDEKMRRHMIDVCTCINVYVYIDMCIYIYIF